METIDETIQQKKNFDVFVVEDCDSYRSLIMYFINDDGNNNYSYTVHGFSNGESCLHSLSITKPSVLVLDYYLDSNGYIDNMNGLSLINIIKRRSPNTKIIMLTSQKDPLVRKRFINEGVVDYIIKDSISKSKVKNMVTTLLDWQSKDIN